MAQHRSIRAIVFDFGGVLTGPIRESITSSLVTHRIDADRYALVIGEWLARASQAGTPVHRLETGSIAPAEFERLLAAQLVTVDGSPVVPDGLLSRLFGGLTVLPTMVDLVREIGSLGLRTGLLSNSWGNSYPMTLIDEIFDGAVISGEVGLRKPDPMIYRMMLERIDVTPEESVFIDDSQSNTDAATALGMRAILHTDPVSTRARLTELIPTLERPRP